MSPPSKVQKMAGGVFLLATALYVVLVDLHRGKTAAPDTYAYYIPNMLHAARSLWQGGKGLLWNPFQSCGGPFFANPVTGLLYPPHLLFFVLDANVALHAVLIINMLVGAAGAFLLMRELGLSQTAALGGALAFEIGDPMSQFTNWSPMTNGPWAWVPWALLFCERLLRAPSRGNVVGLAAVLGLQLLPGAVLIAAITYQLIALRVVWEIVTRPARSLWRSVVAIVAGLALAPLLVAVQLIPGTEVAQTSLRATLPAKDLIKLHTTPVAQLLAATAARAAPVPFLVVPLLLAAVASLASPTHRLAIFYVLTGVLYVLLGLGEATPLSWVYEQFPQLAVLLRVPHRLMWIGGFCLTVLAALGIEAVGSSGDRPWVRGLRSIAVVVLATVIYGFAPGGLRKTEAAALGAGVVAVLAASVRSGLARPAAWVALVALAFNLFAVPLRWGEGGLLSSTDPLFTYAETFAALRPLIAEQGRVLLMPSLPASFKLGLTLRTATVLRVPSSSDYEAMPARRVFEYFSMMQWGFPFVSLADPRLASWKPTDVRPRLLNLASIRYLIASPSVKVADQALGLQRVTVGSPDLRILLNDMALPRARYVNRVEVVEDSTALLNRLANGSDDLTAVALLEEPMPSGFTGVAGSNRPGTARFITNDPEHLVIDVDAPERGFLILSDQYYPGWRAAVNGETVPILRANYMFRLIEVPAGSSRVEFRFRPTSILLGAIVSAMVVGALAVFFLRSRRRSLP